MTDLSPIARRDLIINLFLTFNYTPFTIGSSFYVEGLRGKKRVLCDEMPVNMSINFLAVFAMCLAFNLCELRD